MKKYFLYERQRGDGCDYTISCGSRLTMLSAKSMEEAIEEVIDLPEDVLQEILESGDEDRLHDFIYDSGLRRVIEDKWNPNSVLTTCTILEVESEKDMMSILKFKLNELNKLRATLQQKKLEEAERAQYENLKKKFEKSL